MKLGSKVKYKDKYGIGQIISKAEIFNNIYFEVFFKKVNNTIQVKKEDLELLPDPSSLLSAGYSSDLNAFFLKNMAHSLEQFYNNQDVISSVNFKIQPLPHQILALNFVLNKFKTRCLLADEVGLGKTIEAALIFEELKLRGTAKRVLIITPAGLTNQWQEEMKLKFDEDFYILNKDKANALEDLHGEEGNIWFEFDQVITSIDFLKSNKLSDEISEAEYKRRKEHNEKIYDSCIDGDWDIVIFDEAHKLTKYKSGRETARYKLGKELAEVTPTLLLLTATPHNGKPAVFQNMLKLIDPHLFYNRDNLVPEKVKQVTVRNKKRAVVDMEGKRIFKNRITNEIRISRNNSSDEAEKELYNNIVDYVSEYYDLAKFEKNYPMIFLLMLYQRIVSSSSRAIKKTLEKRYKKLKKVKDISRRLNSLDLEDLDELSGEEQLEFIESNMAFLKNDKYLNKEINIIENCIKSAEKSLNGNDDAKLNKLLEIIDFAKQKEKDPELKIIVFTEFIETQNYILESLEKLGYKTAHINGKLSLEEKILQKNKFKEESQILVSTDAGGEGINLQFCSYMINYDLPWNPMKLEQRIGRIDRIGQKEDVKIFNFILEDTVEEHVREILENKLRIIKEQFGEDKFGDVLSTLQEDFNFNQLYFDAVINDELEEAKLDQIGEEMYNKAKNIIEDEDYLIPFNKKNELKKADKKVIEEVPKKVKSFIKLFFKSNNMELNEYSRDENIYYFQNNFANEKFKNHFSKVIFKPSKGLNTEDADLFSLKHDYVKEVIKESKKEGYVSAFEINDNRFASKSGLLSYWKLNITNNFNYNYTELISIFIEDTERFNRRISKAFADISDFDNFNLGVLPDYSQVKSLEESAKKEAEKEAEDIFLSEKLDWTDKLKQQKSQLEEYFKQKREAVENIKVDNIKKGKLSNLASDYDLELEQLKEKEELFPKLDCVQLAYVEFK